MTASPPLSADAQDSLAGIRPLLTMIGGALAVALPATRPLVWDGDPLEPANLAWWTVCMIAVMVGLLERRTWRIGPLGAAAALAVLALAPAAWRAAHGASDWALAGQCVLLLAYAGWLTGQVEDRARLVWVGVLTGLAGEAIISGMQAWWVLPAMQHQQATVGLGIQAPEIDVVERLRLGGIFGTFTLSNTLGCFLIMLLPATVAAAWRAGGVARVAGLVLAAGGVAVLYGTHAKGAILALVAGLLVAWTFHGPGGRRLRWGLPVVAVVAAVAAMVLSSGLRDKLAPSAEVRLGYWRSAVTLVAEAPYAGHGIGGFAAQSDRVMRPGDEPTRLAHCEPLEAAVSGGVVAGLLVAALLAAMAVRPTALRPALDTEPALPVPALIVLPILIVYLAVLNGFTSNLGWWPGSETYGRLAMYGWSVVLGAALAAICAALMRTPLPPAWAVRAGLAGAALHACIDFDLHAAGIVATIAALAALSGAGPGWRVPRIVPIAALILSGVLLVLGWFQSLATTTATAIAAEVAEAGKADPPLGPAEADRLLADAAAATLGDRTLALRITGQRAAGSDRIDASRRLVVVLPHAAMAWRLLVDDLAKLGDWDAALGAAERMAACSPTDLHVVRYRIGVIEAAAGAKQRAGLPVEALRQSAAALRATVAELEPRVHFRLR